MRPSKVDESRIMADHPRTFALRAAYAKAMDVAAAVPEGQWVLAADTVVTRGMILYGKPEGEADAARMLRGLSGQPHQVITGLALAQGGSPNTFLRATATTVQFRQLSDSEIAAYIRTGEPMDKAGAYGIQGLGAVLVEGIEGDHSGVVGLPVPLLVRLLAEAGIGYRFPERG